MEHEMVKTPFFWPEFQQNPEKQMALAKVTHLDFHVCIYEFSNIFSVV